MGLGKPGSAAGVGAWIVGYPFHQDRLVESSGRSPEERPDDTHSPLPCLAIPSALPDLRAVQFGSLWHCPPAEIVQQRPDGAIRPQPEVASVVKERPGRDIPRIRQRIIPIDLEPPHWPWPAPRIGPRLRTLPGWMRRVAPSFALRCTSRAHEVVHGVVEDLQSAAAPASRIPALEQEVDLSRRSVDAC